MSLVKILNELNEAAAQQRAKARRLREGAQYAEGEAYRAEMRRAQEAEAAADRLEA
jgi:hypothetical protein